MPLPCDSTYAAPGLFLLRAAPQALEFDREDTSPAMSGPRGPTYLHRNSVMFWPYRPLLNVALH